MTGLPARDRRRRAVLGTIAALAMSTLLPGAGPIRAQSQEPFHPPRMVLPPFRVNANDLFNWTIWVRIVNPSSAGIYNDSMTCTVVDLDPGETGRSRRQRMELGRLVGNLETISAHDSVQFQYSGSAAAEHARVIFTLYGRDPEVRRYAVSDSIELHPGPTSLRFPSKFLKVGREKIEYVVVPEVWPTGPSPGLLLVHGEGSHARRLLPSAWDLANHGYSVVAVSLPGRGQSTGKVEFADEAGVKAASLALDVLRRLPQVDSARVGVLGISSGATVAALLAQSRDDISALVLQSGIYDLPAVYAATSSEELKKTLRAAGSKKVWEKRSPLARAAAIKAPVLLLHGQEDTFANAAQAGAMSARLQEAGRKVSIELIPDGGHTLTGAMVDKPIRAFLKERLKPDK